VVLFGIDHDLVVVVEPKLEIIRIIPSGCHRTYKYLGLVMKWLAWKVERL
jgi:hypothetical protein